MHAARFAAALALTCALAACGPKNIRLADTAPGTGLVYGQVVLPEGYEMAHVMLLKPGKVYVGRIGVPVHVLEDGRFVAENVPAGEYMFGGFQTGQVRNIFGNEALKYKFNVRPGQIYYLGSYEYIEGPKKSLFDAPTFDLKKLTGKKHQAELLQWLEASSAGSGWQPKLRQELAKYQRYLPKGDAVAAKP